MVGAAPEQGGVTVRFSTRRLLESTVLAVSSIDTEERGETVLRQGPHSRGDIRPVSLEQKSLTHCPKADLVANPKRGMSFPAHHPQSVQNDPGARCDSGVRRPREGLE